MVTGMTLQDNPEITVPEQLPILPVSDAVVYPYMMAPLSVRSDDVPLVDAVVSGDRLLGVVVQSPESDREEAEGSSPPGAGQLYDIGCAAIVQKMLQMPDESRRLLIRGVARIRIEEYVQTEPFRIARVSAIEEIEPEGEQVEAWAQSLLDTFQQIVDASPALPEEAYLQALNVPSRAALCDLIASALDIDVLTKQKILETTNVADRLQIVSGAVHRELARLQAAQRVSSEAREEIERTQRDYFLRQQLKAIQRELGEEGESEEGEGGWLRNCGNTKRGDTKLLDALVCKRDCTDVLIRIMRPHEHHKRLNLSIGKKVFYPRQNVCLKHILQRCVIPHK